jgi:hypothetical protein
MSREVGKNVKAWGLYPGFDDMVQSDIDALASIPSGRKLLGDIDKSRNTGTHARVGHDPWTQKYRPNTRRAWENEELATTGLPFDHDQDPKTPDVEGQGATENEIRKDLRLDKRTSY